jgi:hypothetical protein
MDSTITYLVLDRHSSRLSSTLPYAAALEMVCNTTHMHNNTTALGTVHYTTIPDDSRDPSDLLEKLKLSLVELQRRS